ncbi:MAG: hypothetical protein ACQCN6_01720 [Candidatus Bathyarchaeia archaeon]|jgi:hypothetical protein
MVDKPENEPEVFNLKELREELKEMKQIVESLRPAEQGAKGHVEEGVEGAVGGKNSVEEAVKVNGDKLRSGLLEFLKTAEVGKSFKVEEAIGALSPSNAVPAIWSAEPELLSPGGADGYFLTPIVKWKTDVKGQPGDTVYVKTFAAVATAAITSGTEPTFTASSVSRVPVTLVQRGHGFYITKNDLEDLEDGDVDMILEQSKKGVMRAVDAYFLTQLQVDATMAAAGTITEAGAMAATVLAKMWGSLNAGSYPANGAVIMHPVQYASLLQDDQFTNASTRGKSSIIETGTIGNYLGMDIVPLVQGTLNATGGTYRAFMMSKGALVGAIKRDISFEREYYVKDQRSYFVASIRFGGTPAHTYGIGLMLTVD